MTHTVRFVITEISDIDVNPEYVSTTPLSDYHVRKAARGILIKDGKIAMLNVAKNGYHKLPGGGMELNETPEEAFKREILEETGYGCEISDEDGENSVTIEYWDTDKELQISYIFFAKALGEQKELGYTEEEISKGFELEWVPFEEIDNTLEKDNPKDYEGKFIHLREKAIIDFYRKLLT